jgi:hypothetical protein
VLSSPWWGSRYGSLAAIWSIGLSRGAAAPLPSFAVLSTRSGGGAALHARVHSQYPSRSALPHSCRARLPSAQLVVGLQYVQWTQAQARVRAMQQKEFHLSQLDYRPSEHISRATYACTDADRRTTDERRSSADPSRCSTEASFDARKNSSESASSATAPTGEDVPSWMRLQTL